MSDHPDNPPSGYHRKIERLEFEQDCEVEVTSPTWAMTREPIFGMTENITVNGLKVVIQKVPSQRADQWVRALEAFERIMVKVRLSDSKFPLQLPGQIVWCRLEPIQESDQTGAEIGVLFSVLRDSEARSLQVLLTSLDTAF